jgi:hypothetical protein
MDGCVKMKFHVLASRWNALFVSLHDYAHGNHSLGCVALFIFHHHHCCRFTVWEQGGDYHGDRTILHMLQFLMLVEDSQNSASINKHADMALSKHLNISQSHQEFERALQRTHKHHEEIVPNAAEHVGCQLAGSLYMNRVPGHFFIQAQSTGHSLDPRMTNLSMTIHHLAFHGMDAEPVYMGRRKPSTSGSGVVPDSYARLVAPMDEQAYVTDELHQAHHLHLKLVPTNINDYQVLHSSHLSLYAPDRVPEIKFVMDISPIAVHYRMRRRPWYDYMTSVLAIVGGSFTLLGMLASFFRVSTQQFTRKKFARPPPKRAAP